MLLCGCSAKTSLPVFLSRFSFHWFRWCHIWCSEMLQYRYWFKRYQVFQCSTWMLDSASVRVDFHQDSWLAEGSQTSFRRSTWEKNWCWLCKKERCKWIWIIGTIVFIIEWSRRIQIWKWFDSIIPIRLESGVVMDSDGTLWCRRHGDNTNVQSGNANPDPYTLCSSYPAQDRVVSPQRKDFSKFLTSSIHKSNWSDQSTLIPSIPVDVSSLPVELYYLQVHTSMGDNEDTVSNQNSSAQASFLLLLWVFRPWNKIFNPFKG
jgi:hypothetical protein